ncbi:MAG: thioredoxin family protein [Candidatus Hermodarchaeota archaeon]
MIYLEEIVIQILIKEDPENSCAKCCKTMQVIERMMETTNIFKEKVEIIYMDATSKEVIEKFGELEAPAVFINGKLFTKGHVPIIKKLGKEILEMLNE